MFIDTINLDAALASNSKHHRKYCRSGRIGTNCLCLDLFPVQISSFKLFWIWKSEVLFRGKYKLINAWQKMAFWFGYNRQFNQALGGFGIMKLSHFFNYNLFDKRNQSKHFYNSTPKFDIVIRRVNGLEYFLMNFSIKSKYQFIYERSNRTTGLEFHSNNWL